MELIQSTANTEVGTENSNEDTVFENCMEILDVYEEVEPVMFKRHFFIYKDRQIIAEFDFEHDIRVNNDEKTINDIIMHQTALNELIERIKQELITYEGSEEEYNKNYQKYSILN